MGKRSNFTRRPQDKYYTPYKAVEPLNKYDRFPNYGVFAEPCAGNGKLVEHLETIGLKCMWSSDIEPEDENIQNKDVFEITLDDIKHVDYIITNPPWSRKILHPMIEHCVNLKPTWFLFDAGWSYTKQSSELINKYCTDIIAVGRLKWIEDSPYTGKDDCAWYQFNKHKVRATEFHGR